MRVVGLTRDEMPEELVRAGVENAGPDEGFRELLRPPRAVFLYVPAGDVVDRRLDDLSEVLERGDVIADGGNWATPSAATAG